MLLPCDLRRSVLAAAISVAAFMVHADTAIPDPAFNAGSAVLTAMPGALHARARAVLEGQDGALYVAGNTGTGDIDAGADFLLARYLPDGSLDSSFGHYGIVLTSLGDKRDIAYAIVQQADGKLVLAGGSEGGPAQGSFALVRYLPDGSLDSSFNGNAAVITPINIGNISAFALVQQADGKLLAAGHYNANGFALVRYLPDGSLDTSFGNGTGHVVTTLGSRAWGNALTLQPDGRIVLAGHSGDKQSITVLRYLPDGSLDSSFGNNGIVNTVTGSQQSVANSVIVQPDGKLLAVGSSRLDGSEQQSMVALRYLPDGALDESFGVGGVAVVSGCSGMTARAVALQADGSYLVAGRAQDADKHVSTALARLLPDGSLDMTFGQDGIALLPRSGDSDVMQALLQQRDGKLLVAGFAKGSASNTTAGVLLQRVVVGGTP